MKKVQSKLRPTEIGVVKTFSLSPDSEIGEIAVECSSKTYYYNNLEELCEKWKDYEKPEGYWFVAGRGVVEHALATGDENDPFDKGHKELGNYFDTYEEAKQTVEKLQALKRLKDKGFKVELWDYDGSNCAGRIRTGRILFRVEDCEEVDGLLDLLFGGEE